MVDKPGQVTTLCGIDDAAGVDPEEVTAPDSHLLVVRLPLVCDALPDALAHVLDDHLIRSDVLHGVQTPSVDSTLGEFQFLLAELGFEKEKNG